MDLPERIDLEAVIDQWLQEATSGYGLGKIHTMIVV
jgi:hypothetical protein